MQHCLCQALCWAQRTQETSVSPQGTREAGKQRGADGHAGATGSMTDRRWGCEEGGVTDPPSKAEQAAMSSQRPSRLLLPWSCQGTQVEKEAKLAPGTPKSCRSGRGLGLVSQGLPSSPPEPLGRIGSQHHPGLCFLQAQPFHLCASGLRAPTASQTMSEVPRLNVPPLSGKVIC